MISRQDKANPNDDADDEADHETKTGRIADGTLAQIKNARRLVFVHGVNLHLCPPRTTAATENLCGDNTATTVQDPADCFWVSHRS